MTPLDRLLSKIEYRNGHGFFTGYIKSGYGHFTLDGRVISAHRAYLILITGVDHTNLYAAHTCEYKHCVIHSRWATPLENNQEVTSKITHCPHGHEYTNDNIYWHGNERRCRRCHLTRAKATREAKRVVSG